MSNAPDGNAAGPSNMRPAYYPHPGYTSGPSASQMYGTWATPYPYPDHPPAASAYSAYVAPPPHPLVAVKQEETFDTPLASMSPSLVTPHVSNSPSFAPHWDSALKAFLLDLGMTESLRGLELDVIAMNPDWEKEKVPSALARLIDNVKALSSEGQALMDSEAPTVSLEERKLDQVHLANGMQAVPPSTITKSISKFLAQNRARNDASNRAEFLISLEEKRALRDDGINIDDDSTCARTDTKHVDRAEQIKYDVAKNDDHLRRTTKKPSGKSSSFDKKGKEKVDPLDQTAYTEKVTAERHPGLNNRIQNVECHVAIHYVPSPPLSLLVRLKLLEDHIIKLEREYPPWAALHFNQPNRDWPPPPPSTPLIVPSHIQKTAKVIPVISSSVVQSNTDTGRNQSSLHRAVMERLEVQKLEKAMKAKNPG